MAFRGMAAAYQNELAKNSIVPFNLVEILFSVPLRFTDHFKDISWNTFTWKADGNLSGVPSIIETTSSRVQEVDIELSGANLANVAVALTEPYLFKLVNIYRGLADADMVLIQEPIQVYSGTVDSFEHNERTNGSSSLTWKVSSHWATFEKRNGRRTNHSDQLSHFPNDNFFKFAAVIIKQEQWK